MVQQWNQYRRERRNFAGGLWQRENSVRRNIIDRCGNDYGVLVNFQLFVAKLSLEHCIGISCFTLLAFDTMFFAIVLPFSYSVNSL